MAATKHNGYITESLGQSFDFVPYCPEVAIGPVSRARRYAW
jgi:hypothetical protein